MTTKLSRAEKLKNEQYRKALVEAHLSINIPYQIRALRKQREWEQGELAEKAGMKQPTISRLEKPGYGKTNLDTLIRLANAFDVALIVRFATYRDLLNWSEQFSPDEFQVRSFSEDDLGSQSMAQNSASEINNLIARDRASRTYVANAFNVNRSQPGFSGFLDPSKLQGPQIYFSRTNVGAAHA